MSEIKINDRVKWTSQSGSYTREKVGIVVGIVPDNGEYKIDTVCTVRTHNHTLRFDVRYPGRIMGARPEISYLVSVKVGKTDKAKRALYRPRRVTLCDPGDKRDGVYPVLYSEKGK